MTDITELVLIKGQKVEAPYYLAECTECGKMYSSSKLIVSRNYFDGDADCYCPHCNAEDADIADLGSGEQPAVMAWNYQQARIDVLVEALEKAQQRIAELDRKNCELDSLTQRWAVERAENADHIAELESHLESADKLQDSAFRSGLQHGFSLGQTDDQKGYEQSMAAYSPDAGIKMEAE